MPKVILDISMSLDGYVAGPNQTLEEPLGVGGERLHDWVFNTKAWREPHGLEGGEGPWEDDPNRDAWWGDDPPFHHAVFVLTHHARERVVKEGGTTFTFVTDGIDSALEQARAAAGDKDVAIAGGARVAQQYLDAGVLDELQIHVAPVLLGGGVRLFENEHAEIELVRVVESPVVTHLRYRVAK